MQTRTQLSVAPATEHEPTTAVEVLGMIDAALSDTASSTVQSHSRILDDDFSFATFAIDGEEFRISVRNVTEVNRLQRALAARRRLADSQEAPVREITP